MCDAGLFPWYERNVEAAGARTEDEINTVVKATWRKLTSTNPQRIADRVRRNASSVVRLNGGNYYHE